MTHVRKRPPSRYRKAQDTKLLVIAPIGVAGISAAWVGKLAFGSGFGPWMIAVALLISLGAVAFLWPRGSDGMLED